MAGCKESFKKANIRLPTSFINRQERDERKEGAQRFDGAIVFAFSLLYPGELSV
jgi:hypothetical protein